jgi:hypothetical protein
MQRFGDAIEGTPVLAREQLIIPISWGGKALVAVTLRTGNVSWVRKGAPVEAGLLYTDDLVIAADIENMVRAFNAADGSVRWEFQIPGPGAVHAAPVLTDLHDRIGRLLGAEPAGMWAGTFHAIGARMLRASAHLVNRTPAFTIYDQDDSLGALKRLMEQHGVSPKQYAPRAIQSAISDAKNALVTPAEYERLAMDPFAKTVAPIYRSLGEALQRGREDGLGARGVVPPQRQRAFDGGQLRVVGRDARGEAAQPLGFVQVAAPQRELRLHDVGAEQVGVQADAARQCRLRRIELA